MARRFWWAAGFALLACSFEEAVIVAHGLPGGRVGVASVVERTRQSVRVRRNPAATRPWPSVCRSVRGWRCGPTLTVAFVLIARYAAFTRYQTGRFDEPGRIGNRHCLVAAVAAEGILGRSVAAGRFLLFLLTLLLPLDSGSAVEGTSCCCSRPFFPWGC